jgi:hypothetical protein
VNKQQLEAKLEQAWSESGKLRIAILRSLGRDPYDWPPPDDELIRLLLVRQVTDRQLRTWYVIEREDGSISVYYTTPTSQAQFVVWDSLDANPAGLTCVRADGCADDRLPDVELESGAAAQLER